MAGGFDSMAPQALLLAGCGLLSWTLLRRFHRRTGARGRRPASSAYLERTPRPAGPWDGAQRDAWAQIERQKVEFHEQSREACGRMEAKMLLLEQLIATSHGQIARLEELLARMEASRGR
jgi:hypothetical protein